MRFSVCGPDDAAIESDHRGWQTIRRGLRTLTTQQSRYLIIASTGSHSTRDKLSGLFPHWDFLVLGALTWHGLKFYFRPKNYFQCGGMTFVKFVSVSPATLDSTQTLFTYLHIKQRNFTVCCVIRFNVGKWIQKRPGRRLRKTSFEMLFNFQMNEKRIFQISFPLYAKLNPKSVI